jgi:hypothetical protein
VRQQIAYIYTILGYDDQRLFIVLPLSPATDEDYSKNKILEPYLFVSRWYPYG